MNEIKLTYFDIVGGRGEPTRIAMSIAGLNWQDHRISFTEFGQMRSSFPLQAVPVLEINGGVYTQSNAMSRYFGKQAGLYPEDRWQAFKCDEIMEALEDVAHHTVQTFGLEGEQLRSARQKLADETFTTFLKFLNLRLAAAGGIYFANNCLTMADLKVFVWIRALTSGVFDHIPANLTNKIAPQLELHMERVAAEPGVVAYYSKQ